MRRVISGLTAADYAIEILQLLGPRVYAKASYDNRWQAEELPAGLYYFLLRHRLAPFSYWGRVEVVR